MEKLEEPMSAKQIILDGLKPLFEKARKDWQSARPVSGWWQFLHTALGGILKLLSKLKQFRKTLSVVAGHRVTRRKAKKVLRMVKQMAKNGKHGLIWSPRVWPGIWF
jgi:hypothetical protein